MHAPRFQVFPTYRQPGLGQALVLISLGLCGCASSSARPVVPEAPRLALAARPLPNAAAPAAGRASTEHGPAASEWSSWPADVGLARAAQDPEVPAGDQGETFQAEQGWFAAAYYQTADLGGDFDGEDALVGPDVIFIPEAGSGDGFEFAVGQQSGPGAWELVYTRQVYDGTTLIGDGDIDVQSIYFNGVRYFNRDQRLQPYGLLGIGFSWAELEEASTDEIEVGSADLAGFGLGAGGGLAYYLNPHLAIDLRGQLRYAWYGTAEGVAGEGGSIDDAVDAFSWSLGVGARYVF